jgi:L-malate glycosyltransferase
MQIHQLIPAFHTGDAIGNNALAIRNHFRDQGYQSEIFSIEADPELSSETYHFNRFSAVDGPDTVVILHYALPSILNELFKQSSGYKILIYHNITPPAMLRGYPHYQHIAVAGREALKSLVNIPDRALADSEYNRQELESLGFDNTSVMPLFIDFDQYAFRPNRVISKMFEDDFTNILFVGRLSPNKCQHDLIRLYGIFKRCVRERSRLFLIGKTKGFERYYYQLSQMASRLKLGDVYLLGGVTQEELVTYYTLADVFVSLSEHEGFCVPLIESMFFDIPVLAYRTTAIPYTLNGSGVLISDKSEWIKMAEMIEIMTTNKAFRTAVIQKQKVRLSDFSREAVGALWHREVARIH